MSLLFTSQNPSLLSTTTTTITTATFRHFSATSLPFLLHPKRIKSPPIRVSSNKPPSSPGWNLIDQTLNDDEESDGIQPPTVTDEWGEKSEPLTKLPTSDPPQNEDEWGTGNRNVTKEPIKDEGYGSGSTVVEDDGKLQELKRCLVDSVYGTGLGFKASQEERAEIIESTPAPTDAVEFLDGNWVLFIRNQKPAKMEHAQQYSTVFTLSPLKLPNVHTKTPSSSIRMRFSKIRSKISIKEHPFPPNAMRRKKDSRWMGGFSLGIDLGLSRTGIALSKGFSIRPLKVLELRGQKLEMSLLQIAQQQEVDEFIIGLPISLDGKETPQSNKVRSVAGRFAIQAAERGWRVYLQNEHGTSTDAMNRMIDLGLNKSARKESLDAYAAMMVLERYFSESGQGAEIVLPKQLDLQEKIRKGPPTDEDFDFF